jgi:hypothetical protein
MKLAGRIALIAAVPLIAASVAGGYLIGTSQAASTDDAAEAQERAHAEALADARTEARAAAHERGLEAGLKEGRDAGARVGTRRGKASGEAEAGSELAQTAEAQAAAAERAALEEVRERAANCEAPLFVEGYCPTDEEIARENQAESLCGPGTAEGRREAAALGIQC